METPAEAATLARVVGASSPDGTSSLPRLLRCARLRDVH
jgi:hypothetical protein